MNAALTIILAIIAFASDQLSKAWVLYAYALGERGFVEVLPILNFVYAENKGINFGLFAADSDVQQWILAGIAVGVSIALLIWGSRTADRRISVAAGLVIGGALANGLDRINRGAVFDFINMHCCGIANPYAFNLADVWIFAGAGLLLIFTWNDGSSQPRNAAG
ncbi:MAG: signal peptidase II [Pseudomonadota bacterium]